MIAILNEKIRRMQDEFIITDSNGDLITVKTEKKYPLICDNMLYNGKEGLSEIIDLSGEDIDQEIKFTTITRFKLENNAEKGKRVWGYGQVLDEPLVNIYTLREFVTRN